MTPPGASSSLGDIRRCGVHPEAVAVDTCVRCGAFVCGECLELIGEAPFCRSCYQRREVTGRASARATFALLLGAASLYCGPPAAIASLLLVWRERKALEQGKAPLSSEPFLKVAKALSWTGLALTAAAVLAAAAFAVFRVFFSEAAPGEPPSS